jgi:alpha-L-arabinofuranosidase
MDRGRDEGLAASRLELELRRPLAALVYNAQRMAALDAFDGFGVEDYGKTLKSTLFMDEFLRKQEAVMDKYDPEKKVALVVDEWGAWHAPLPGTNKTFWSSRTACETRFWRR